ncbi:MAG: hypothetical protein JST54_25910 [Deltaproteobacteria bacterium]|nr:hypothetical protein [Deltaproteobacteria bacterium]
MDALEFVGADARRLDAEAFRESCSTIALDRIKSLTRIEACRASDETLRATTGMSHRSWRRALEDLVNAGRILIETSPARAFPGESGTPVRWRRDRRIYLVFDGTEDEGALRVANACRSRGKTTRDKDNKLCALVGCTPHQLRAYLERAKLSGYLHLNHLHDDGTRLITRISYFPGVELGHQLTRPAGSQVPQRMRTREQLRALVASAPGCVLEATEREIANLLCVVRSHVHSVITTAVAEKRIFAHRVAGRRVYTLTPETPSPRRAGSRLKDKVYKAIAEESWTLRSNKSFSWELGASVAAVDHALRRLLAKGDVHRCNIDGARVLSVHALSIEEQEEVSRTLAAMAELSAEGSPEHASLRARWLEGLERDKDKDFEDLLASFKLKMKDRPWDKTSEPTRAEALAAFDAASKAREQENNNQRVSGGERDAAIERAVELLTDPGWLKALRAEWARQAAAPGCG